MPCSKDHQAAIKGSLLRLNRLLWLQVAGLHPNEADLLRSPGSRARDG